MATTVPSIMPGQHVRVTQQIPQGEATWTTTIEGQVVAYRQAKTGSWFAHSKDDRLWLDRLELRRRDGEIVVCNLDRFSRVEVLGESPAPATGGEDGAPSTSDE